MCTWIQVCTTWHKYDTRIRQHINTKNVKKPWCIIQETDGRLPSGIGAWWTSAAKNNKWHEYEQLRVWHRSKTLKKTSSLQSRLFSCILRDFIHILCATTHLLFCKMHFYVPKKFTYNPLVFFHGATMYSLGSSRF